MADATFKAYSGSGYTHCGGGGLLQPNDYHGWSALLVEQGESGGSDPDAVRQRRALRRLLDPVYGNPLVLRTFTCLEREIEMAQPTIQRKRGRQRRRGAGSVSGESGSDNSDGSDGADGSDVSDSSDSASDDDWRDGAGVAERQPRSVRCKHFASRRERGHGCNVGVR